MRMDPHDSSLFDKAVSCTSCDWDGVLGDVDLEDDYDEASEDFVTSAVCPRCGSHLEAA